jgi:hypothetical protein
MPEPRSSAAAGATECVALTSPRVTYWSAWRAHRQGAGLIDNKRIDIRHAFQRLCILDQGTPACAPRPAAVVIEIPARQPARGWAGNQDRYCCGDGEEPMRGLDRRSI